MSVLIKLQTDRDTQSQLSQEEFISLYEEAWTNERAGRTLSLDKKERLQWYFDELSAPHSLRGEELIIGTSPFFQVITSIIKIILYTDHFGIKSTLDLVKLQEKKTQAVLLK
jgi:hypothetical protein